MKGLGFRVQRCYEGCGRMRWGLGRVWAYELCGVTEGWTGCSLCCCCLVSLTLSLLHSASLWSPLECAIQNVFSIESTQNVFFIETRCYPIPGSHHLAEDKSYVLTQNPKHKTQTLNPKPYQVLSDTRQLSLLG